MTQGSRPRPGGPRPGRPQPRGTSQQRRTGPSAAQVAAGPVAGAAEDRVPADRDGRLGLRGPAVPAAGRRRAGVRREGPLRGRRDGDPAGDPRHDHRPQRRRPRGVRRRPDDHRRPAADGEERQRDRDDPGPPPRRGLLRHAHPAAQAGHPVPVRRPAGALHAGEVGRRRDRPSRLQGHRHPARPGPDLPGRRRRRQPGRLHQRPGRRRRGRRADVRHDAVGQGRLRVVRDRRRQPDPARRQQHGPAAQRPRPPADHRPRRAVVHPARRPLRGPGLRRLVGLGRRDGHPHRAAPRARRLPDVRRQPAEPVLQGQPRLPRAARRLRAGLGREGADRLVADRRRQGHPEHQDHRPVEPAARRPGDPRLLRAPQAAPDADRRDREVLQHRHRARGQPVQAQGALRLPPQVRPRCAHRDRRAGRDPGRAEQLEGLVADQPGHHRLRAGPGRQRRPDGRRGQHRGQRRRLREAEPGQGPGDHLRRGRRRARPPPPRTG